MTWHERSGILILVLVLFRWGWGFLGSTSARFSDFVHGPRRVVAYASALLQHCAVHVAGHNPLGGWMVVLLLGALTLQAGGLFADDDIFTSGPLAHLIGGSTRSLLTAIHGSNAWVVITLAGIHVAAVLFHLLIRRENLVRPMIDGRKAWPAEIPPPALRFAPAGRALLLLLFTLGTVLAVLAFLGN